MIMIIMARVILLMTNEIIHDELYPRIGALNYKFKLSFIISGLKFRLTRKSRDITHWSNDMYYDYVMFKLTYRPRSSLMFLSWIISRLRTNTSQFRDFLVPVNHDPVNIHSFPVDHDPMNTFDMNFSTLSGG